MSEDLNQRATKDWIVDRWGDDHLTLAHNKDLAICFKFKKLWLRYESEGKVIYSKLLSKGSLTRQDVLDAERVLGCKGDIEC